MSQVAFPSEEGAAVPVHLGSHCQVVAVADLQDQETSAEPGELEELKGARQELHPASRGYLHLVPQGQSLHAQILMVEPHLAAWQARRFSVAYQLVEPASCTYSPQALA